MIKEEGLSQVEAALLFIEADYFQVIAALHFNKAIISASGGAAVGKY